MSYKISLFFLSVFLISCGQLQIANHERSPQDKFKIDKCKKILSGYIMLSKFSRTDKKFAQMAEESLDSSCGNNFAETIATLNKHRGRVGILIEQDPKDATKTDAIVSGMKYSYEKINPKYKANFVIRKVTLKKSAIKTAMAQLIHEKKVGLIVTWGRKPFLDYIQKWQNQLEFPMVFINKNLQKNKNAFNVFPNTNNVNETIVDEMRKKGISSIAMLIPEKYKNSDYIKSIRRHLKKAGIEIVFDESYDSDIGESMDFACKKLFIIDRNKRYVEFNEILRAEREKATRLGYKLNPKLVFLHAKVTFDAFFIPDNFKSVRYFVKLFKYYKAPKIPLFGTYEWRSPDLLSPKEPYLNGSSFVDYIGEYKSLPILDENYEYRSKQGESIKIDYKIMGYYSALLSQVAVKKSRGKRNKIKSVFKKLKVNDNFLKNRHAFQKNKFNWPTFSFEIDSYKYQVSTPMIPTDIYTTQY